MVLRLHVQHRPVPGWSSGKTNSNLLVGGIPSPATARWQWGVLSRRFCVPGQHTLLPTLTGVLLCREAGGAHGVEGGGVAGHELELAGGLVEEEVEAVGHGGSGLAGGGRQGGGPGVVDDVDDGAGAEGALGYPLGVGVGRAGGDGRYQQVRGGRGGCRRG